MLKNKAPKGTISHPLRRKSFLGTPMGSAFALKNKAQQEEELSKETHTQTQKAAEDTQKHRNNSARKGQ
jgi:hypothetical protein